MSFIPYIFELLIFIGLFSGIIVVSTINAIHRIVLLIIVFLIGALIFILLDFYFLGLTQLIVYVGAIAILFLFVIMMVNINERILSPNNIAINNFGMINNDLRIETTGINDLIIGLIGTNMKNKQSFGDDLTRMNFNPSNENILLNPTKGFNYPKGLGFIILTFIISQVLWGFTIQDANILVTYFYPNWTNDYIYFTDIQTLSIITYLVYPLSLIIIAIILIITLIGIITITSHLS